MIYIVEMKILYCLSYYSFARGWLQATCRKTNKDKNSYKHSQITKKR